MLRVDACMMYDNSIDIGTSIPLEHSGEITVPFLGPLASPVVRQITTYLD